MPDRYASLKQGLVGCWIPSVSGSGLLLPDLSQYGNHGSLVGMDASDWVSSGEGRALDFDGSNDYVQTTASLNGLTAFTVSGWMKPTAINQRMEIGQTNSGNDRAVFGLAEDGNAYCAPNVNTGYGYCNWSSLGVSKFIHFTGVFNSQGATNSDRAIIYLNGVKQTLNFVSAVSTSPVSYSNNIRFGTRNLDTFSQGQLDDARVYNRALTPSEISLLASKRGIGLQPSPTRFIAREKKTGLRRKILTGQT